MKLKSLVKDARFGLVLLAVSAQLFTACSGSKKATASKIPKSYGTTAAKGTNAEARLLYLDIYKAIATGFYFYLVHSYSIVGNAKTTIPFCNLHP